MAAQASGVVIVGGGQAGLALSYHLTAQGQDHVVLEQGRIAASWRSSRRLTLGCTTTDDAEVTMTVSASSSRRGGTSPCRPRLLPARFTICA
jgi:cation diffusion facilitator CzcD-associated flavoprotein CzcO